MARRHVNGALKMAELNGGDQTLGLDGFLAYLLSKLQLKSFPLLPHLP